MANELRLTGYTAGRTIVARLTNVEGEFWHVANAAWEAHGADATVYNIAMTDKDGDNYVGDLPAAITGGQFWALFWDSLISQQAVAMQPIPAYSGAEVDTWDMYNLIDSLVP